MNLVAAQAHDESCKGDTPEIEFQLVALDPGEGFPDRFMLRCVSVVGMTGRNVSR